MALFRDDPTKFMDQYSRDFEGFFMAVMKRKGGMRVRANTVYQEVVADRTHIHMNVSIHTHTHARMHRPHARLARCGSALTFLRLRLCWLFFPVH